jgi:hypothetical protein
MSSVARLAMGGNNPPITDLLKAEFAELSEATVRLQEIAGSLPLEIVEEGQVAEFAGFVKECRATAKQLSDMRSAEKAPFLAAGKEVDTFFNVMVDRLDRVRAAAELRVTAYQRKLAEEERRRAAEIAEMQRKESAEKLRLAAESTSRVEQDVLMRSAESAAALGHRAEAAAVSEQSNLTKMKTEAGTVSTRKSWAFTITDLSDIPLEKLRPFFTYDAIEKAVSAFVRANKDTAPLPGVNIFQDSVATFR